MIERLERIPEPYCDHCKRFADKCVCLDEEVMTPDPRTERAQLDKWLLQTNRYPGTVTAGEAAQHLYDAAAKANDALTTEAARHVGQWSTERPTVPGWYWYRKSGSTQALWVNDELAVFGINLQTDHVEEIIDGEWCPIARPSEEVG